MFTRAPFAAPRGLHFFAAVLSKRNKICYPSPVLLLEGTPEHCMEFGMFPVLDFNFGED